VFRKCSRDLRMTNHFNACIKRFKLKFKT